MLKILNTSQIKEWDNYTIKNEPIASIDLMEKACIAFVQWFLGRFDQTKKIGIVCGTGNNGGDGMGIARLLNDWGYVVEVWVVKGTVLESVDFKLNRQRLPEKVVCTEILGKLTPGIFGKCDVLIDGIFGSGLSRPVEGNYAEAIQEVNTVAVTTVAIDIPSGLFADKHTESISVQADHTITFQHPKLAFLFPENEDRVGHWTSVDIGLSKPFLEETQSPYYLIEKKDIIKRLLGRKKFAHKGDFGKGLLIAGSYGKMGACILAARAAMRSGIGLLTAHVPQCGYQIMQTAMPEVMVSVDESDRHFSSSSSISLDDYTAVGLGPGMGQNKETVVALKYLLENVSKPLVIDADGLNILSGDQELLHLLPEGTILTPHPGELERLIGNWNDDFHRLELAKDLAARTKCILIVKGANSSIVAPDGKVFFNNTGNPGMATAGSGDVLTGIITALLAQQIEPLQAAIIGVFIHGFAGDLAAFDFGYTALTASDIISSLPPAFKQLS